MICKVICTRYSAKKPGMNGIYAIGQKRYSQCQIFINWEGKYCPCCGYVLRTKQKGIHTRNKLMRYSR